MSSMRVIWPYFFASLLTAWLSDKHAHHPDGTANTTQTDRFFFCITALIMSLFVGLRIWCNDTGTYLDMYQYLTPSTGSIFNIDSWSLGDNPGLFVLNRIMKHAGVSNQNYLMLFSLFTNFTYLWFLRKYSKSFLLSVFLIWAMGTYLFTAAAIKQTTAIALGLIGIDGFLEKKWVKYIVFILLGATIHLYVFLFFLAPILTFSPWSKKTYGLLLTTLVAGPMLPLLLGPIIEIAGAVGEAFTVEALNGEGVNGFRLAVVWAPVVFSLFYLKILKESTDTENNLFLNCTLLNAEIMFIALFGTANYFARLANYFQIFQAISIPWLLGFLPRRGKGTYSFVIISCYMLYFVVANTIMTPFDRYFAKMSLWNYLQTLF